MVTYLNQVKSTLRMKKKCTNIKLSVTESLLKQRVYICAQICTCTSSVFYIEMINNAWYNAFN